MTDLILHIGLPKTGTTTLQREYFCNYENYLGRTEKKIKYNYKLINELSNIFKLIYHNKSYANATQKWINMVLNWQYYNCPHARSVIISDEDLACIESPIILDKIFYIKKHNICVQSLNKFSLPVCQALYIFSNYYWTCGNIRVLLTLRNQPEWLASCYNQRSAFLLNPSQKHFEKSIDYILKYKSEILDWSKWVNELQLCVGEKNVCALFTEDMDKAEYWHDLDKFINGNTQKNIYYTFTKLRTRHKRKLNKETWNLTLFHKHVLRKYIKSKMKKHQLSLFSYILYTIVYSIAPIIEFPLFIIGNIKRNSQIHLTQKLDKKIRHYTSKYNTNLSFMLNRDLSKIDY